ncbi:MAG TPA: hypothetical protein VN132_05635, partial [Bdellovibrio sp.]|nr:hypothetical protein [Bdellovibrio sp.]
MSPRRFLETLSLLRLIEIMKFFIFIFLCLLDVSVWARTSLTMGVPFRIRRIPAILEYQNFVSEVLKDAGFDVVVKDTPAKMPYDLLVQGEVDAITYDDKTLTYERKKAVTVSFPLIRAHVRIFYRKDNTKFDPKSLKAF